MLTFIGSRSGRGICVLSVAGPAGVFTIVISSMHERFVRVAGGEFSAPGGEPSSPETFVHKSLRNVTSLHVVIVRSAPLGIRLIQNRSFSMSHVKVVLFARFARLGAIAALVLSSSCSGSGSSGDASGPARCDAESCNAANSGGSCDDSSGQLVCTCHTGYLGSDCGQCAAGYHPAASGACEQDTTTPCAPLPGGSTGPVQQPVLRQTLPASWDENWLASPAVADLDGDGSLEIIAARHSVLYAWDASGAMRWRAAWAHNASDPDEHGDSRMWASPVVGDFDNDGDLEIAVGSDADSSSGVNVAVYDHQGELVAGWPQHFGGSDEVRSIAAGDLTGTVPTRLS
jgi:hypothetical protein